MGERSTVILSKAAQLCATDQNQTGLVAKLAKKDRQWGTFCNEPIFMQNRPETHVIRNEPLDFEGNTLPHEIWKNFSQNVKAS